MIALGAALVVTAGSLFARADEGQELTLSHASVSAGRALTVSGSGCATPENYDVKIDLGSETHMVATDATGDWTTIVQVPEGAEGEVSLTATCVNIKAGEWEYVPATIGVDPAEGQGLDPVEQLVVSHETISLGHYVTLYGVGCPAGATLRAMFGEEERSLTLESGGTWVLPYRAERDSEATEIPITVSCVSGEDEFAYPAVTVAVVAEGDLGSPEVPLPDTGDPSATPSPSAEPSASPTPKPTPPGVPSTGW